MSTAPVNYFDLTKPFYPLVMIYTATFLGLNQLAARGIIDLEHDLRGTQSADDVFSSVLSDDPQVNAGLRKLFGPLELRAECQADRITVPPGLPAREFAEHHEVILPTLMPALGIILVLADGILKNQLSQSEYRQPLPQFLRHVRNAVSHNGYFDFQQRWAKPGASWRTAAWRHFMLTPSMHGHRLFKDGLGIGLLSPGDPIFLLWDIEQSYPGLTA